MKIQAFVNPKGERRDGLADIRIQSESGAQYQLDLPFRDLYRRCGPPHPMALDLLIAASSCYVIDKTVSRSSAHDGWTRDLDVTLTVGEPQKWQPLSGDLAEMLTFLTGDNWKLHFCQTPIPLFQPPKARTNFKGMVRPKVVSLFSGGTDSLAGAIDLMASGQEDHVLLIGHYDTPGPRKTQAVIANRLASRYPGKFDVLHIRVAHRPKKGVEGSLRSRSLVFVALGLFAAQAAGELTPLYMFENGLIALNVPLTPSRRGSCSTRTMHPYYLSRIREMAQSVGIGNPILNPYELKTKGECITQSSEIETLKGLVNTSVSCSHALRRQHWRRRNAMNCGYCVPCIFRRAALHKVGMDSGSLYGIDVLAGELTERDQGESANDLRAIRDFLRVPMTPDTARKLLLATAPLPNLDAHAQLVCRGFAEVKAWLKV